MAVTNIGMQPLLHLCSLAVTTHRNFKPCRNGSLANLIGSTLAVGPIDRIAAVDSSLPAFHADPHRGAKHSRTMEASKQWQLQGCSSLTIDLFRELCNSLQENLSWCQP